MSKKIAVVTGGMGGLGEAISIRLHDAGYKVVVTHSAGNAGVDVWLAKMESAGRQFRAYPVDVADYDSCQHCAAKIQAEVGPVDILVNNAGVTRDMTLKKLDKVNWDTVIRTNLDSVFNMTRLVIDSMRARSYGRIVSISSINGRKGQVGQANYSAAKAGLLGFSKAVAQEGAAKGITCNVIAPGYIATEMVMAVPKEVLEGKILPQIPVGRLGTAEEVARCVVFLAGEEAGFITGACLDANGGQYMA